MTNWYDPESLPKFRVPPVVETAIAVEFGPIAEFDYIKLMRLQDRFLPNYSVISEQNGAPASAFMQTGAPTFELAFGAPLRRLWNVSPGTGRLIQSQTDRLVLNWRAIESESGYPGYRSSERAEFQRLWDLTVGFLHENGLPTPVPVIAEFDYVNRVTLLPDETLADTVTLVRTPDVKIPGEDTFGRFQFVRDVEESDTDPFRAQIVISGEPGQFEELRTLYFTVSAKVLFGGSQDLMKGVDAAHALASHTFARVITNSKKLEWDQYQ